MKKPSDTSTDAARFLSCPKCNAIAAKAENLGRSVVYVRCGACGETWTIQERRRAVRQGSRAARFPLKPPE